MNKIGERNVEGGGRGAKINGNNIRPRESLALCKSFKALWEEARVQIPG
jgi:hypothetical protein